jgi:hypothetical protein
VTQKNGEVDGFSVFQAQSQPANLPYSGHGLLRKLPHVHRYQLTSKGRRIITALLAACYADVEQLTKIAHKHHRKMREV